MKLNVFNKEGELCKLDVDSDSTVEKVKFMALGHFGAFLEDAVERQRASNRFKLLHMTQCRPLDDKRTLSQEGVRDMDELLLNKKTPIFYEDKKDFSMGPSMAEIMVATASLPQAKAPSALQDPKPWGLDFQTEIRSVLITLIQTSHRLLCLDPRASQTFRHFHEKLQPTPQGPVVNREAINKLTEMGFSEQRATKALLLNRMNASQAADWLIEHESDPEVDAAPLTATDRRESRDSAPGMPSSSTADRPDSVLSIHNTTPESIIRAYRSFKKNQFRPSSQAISNLKEMGFDQDDIEEALAVCGNSEDAACEWLLQDPNRTTRTRTTKTATTAGSGSGSRNEDFKALDPDSQVSKALLNDPTILLGLDNPKMFLVLLSMYEAFVATNALHLGQWFNDPDVAIFLSQVFRIYHAEKYGNVPASQISTFTTRSCPITVGMPPSSILSTTAPLDGIGGGVGRVDTMPPRRFSSTLPEVGGVTASSTSSSASYPSSLDGTGLLGTRVPYYVPRYRPTTIPTPSGLPPPTNPLLRTRPPPGYGTGRGGTDRW